MNIGEKIKFLRLQKGLTQEQLGNIINVGQRTISAYESGKATPSVEVLKSLADYFDVAVDYFLSDKPGQTEVEFVDIKFKKVPLYSAPVSAGNGAFPNDIYVLGEINAINHDVDFAVKVVGNSMEPIAPDGSVLFVKKQNYAFNGDMIVCTYDGWIYVKWYVKQNDKILLLSENPTYTPIVVEPKDRFIIHGVVQEVMLQKPKKVVK
ncbi:repressor [Thermosipho melanesiensis]|uniref:Repressor n=2 Tax=Thermosipho melanesiensis TaxID=46541 RepID=A0ABM6GFG3_9BACT|nr:XRE family transcriptional regulator [Thermosipho melanesiensis]ABR31326.1 putative prophage repressor [Thermosipho melanesiensis BI429]APT74391.1 repressor [Thermosipho melanesiensis]OOC36350.1 repressor [Thermosipho melanesiensis]OOC37168.1 repressor [Thermosipho melanesiensis]OOC37920.1 repressor [Thermosipho melanesiensis]